MKNKDQDQGYHNQVSSFSAWLLVKGQAWFKFLRLVIPILFGMYDEISDFIYYFTNEFYSQDIKNSVLFFLVASPIVQYFCWFFIISNLMKNLEDKKQKKIVLFKQLTFIRLSRRKNKNNKTPKEKKKKENKTFKVLKLLKTKPCLLNPLIIIIKVLESNRTEQTIEQEQYRNFQTKLMQRKKVSFGLSFIIQDMMAICCEDIYEAFQNFFSSSCSYTMIKIYFIAFFLSFIIVFLIELKLFPIVVFGIMKYKYNLVVTEKMKYMIMNKKYKKENNDTENSSYQKQSTNKSGNTPKNGYKELIEENEDNENEEDNTVQVWSNVDPPFIDGLLNDTNLIYMIKLGDIAESIFEALPQSVLQYVNNNLTNTWGLFTYTSFFFSIATVFINSINLLIILYGRFVNESSKILTVYQKKQEKENFRMNCGKKVKLYKLQDMSMLQYLNKQSVNVNYIIIKMLQNIQCLHLDFSRKDPIDTDRMNDLSKGFFNMKSIKMIKLSNIYYSTDGAYLANLKFAISEASIQIDKKNAQIMNKTMPSGQSSIKIKPSILIDPTMLQFHNILWVQDLSRYDKQDVQLSINQQIKITYKVSLFSDVQFAYFTLNEKNKKNNKKLENIMKCQSGFHKIFYCEFNFVIFNNINTELTKSLSSLFMGDHYKKIMIKFDEMIDENLFITGKLALKRKVKHQIRQQQMKSFKTQVTKEKDESKNRLATEFESSDMNELEEGNFLIPIDTVEFRISKMTENEEDTVVYDTISMMLYDFKFASEERILFSSDDFFQCIHIKFSQIVKILEISTRQTKDFKLILSFNQSKQRNIEEYDGDDQIQQDYSTPLIIKRNENEVHFLLMQSAVENGDSFCQYLKTSITSNAKSKSERIPALNKFEDQIKEVKNNDNENENDILLSQQMENSKNTRKLPPIPNLRTKNKSVMVLQNAPIDQVNHSKTFQKIESDQSDKENQTPQNQKLTFWKSYFTEIELNIGFPIQYSWTEQLIQTYAKLIRYNQPNLIEKLKFNLYGKLSNENPIFKGFQTFLQQIFKQNNNIQMLQVKCKFYLFLQINQNDMEGSDELFQYFGDVMISNFQLLSSLKILQINGSMHIQSLLSLSQSDQLLGGLENFELIIDLHWLLQDNKPITKCLYLLDTNQQEQDFKEINISLDQMLFSLIDYLPENLQVFKFVFNKTNPPEKIDEVIDHSQIIVNIFQKIQKFKNLKVLEFDLSSFLKYDLAMNEQAFDSISQTLIELKRLNTLNLNLARGNSESVISDEIINKLKIVLINQKDQLKELKIKIEKWSSTRQQQVFFKDICKEMPFAYLEQKDFSRKKQTKSTFLAFQDHSQNLNQSEKESYKDQDLIKQANDRRSMQYVKTKNQANKFNIIASCLPYAMREGKIKKEETLSDDENKKQQKEENQKQNTNIFNSSLPMKDANKFSNLSKKNNGLPKKNENISFGGDGCSEDGIPEQENNDNGQQEQQQNIDQIQNPPILLDKLQQEKIKEQEELYQISFNLPPTAKIVNEEDRVKATNLQQYAKWALNNLQTPYKNIPQGVENSIKIDKYVKLDCGIYIGEWKDKKMNGKGNMIYNDGSEYEGYWINDRRNGSGIVFFPNGDCYYGDWKDGQFYGYGEYTEYNKKIYKGDWYYGSRQGFGKEYVYLNSIPQLFYEGTFQSDMKHGADCKQHYLDDGRYNGDFEKGKRHGKGIMRWPDHRIYEGEFKFDKMDGDGKFSWPDGRVYEGQYKNDQKHGFGSFTQQDGKKYVGEWFKGHQHGIGKEIYPDKRVISGIWENGKRVRVLEQIRIN